MNVFLFMLAGYESTASALAYSTYILATQSHIQDKLRKEIDQHWKEGDDDDDELNYELVNEMTYMEFFIREILRMYRVSGQNSTRINDKPTIVCGHQIDKGNELI